MRVSLVAILIVAASRRVSFDAKTNANNKSKDENAIE